MSDTLASVRCSDGRRYVLDTARVFPACAPTRIQHAVLVPADDSLPVKQVVVRVPACASLCGFCPLTTPLMHPNTHATAVELLTYPRCFARDPRRSRAK